MGADWWKYQYNVIQSIMAMCLVGLVAGLKSLLLGLLMLEMNKLSFCSVGLVKECTCVLGGLSRPLPLSTSPSPDEKEGTRVVLSSDSSSVWRTTVQPLGKGWCAVSSCDLKKRPAKTGMAVYFWPSGR